MSLKTATVLFVPMTLLAGLCFFAGCAQDSDATPASTAGNATQQTGTSTPATATAETVTLSIPGMT